MSITRSSPGPESNHDTAISSHAPSNPANPLPIPLPMRHGMPILTFVLPPEYNMGAVDKPTTIISTKGQVILPKAIRQQRRWEAGTRLVVEDTPDGVLLRPAPLFPVTKPKDVFG